MKYPILKYNPVLKERARNNRNNPTKTETMLWQRLKGKQVAGFDFDRQKPIDDFIIDFYCKAKMLAIEVDGSSHDGNDIYDMTRQSKLESLGIRFLRFTNEQVLYGIENVVAEIEGCLRELEDRGLPP
ncbi:MAG: endonuclease domain-containing protein [Bacteroidia bacterium]|nr:endonuclease domain-containing protein [Bacteroidia bacterium]